MTKGERKILLKDLCARLPYGVKVKYYNMEYPYGSEPVILTPHLLNDRWENIQDVKPYLRPMSSMTEEERKEYNEYYFSALKIPEWEVDFYNAHHFDYRGLIEKGLALEAPEDMYKISNE